MDNTDRGIVLAGDRLAIPGIITPTSLKLPEDLSYEEWERIVDTLKRMEKSVQWWLGDALRFGERKYGETYSQALEASDYKNRGSLWNIKWVADKVEPSLRHEDLTWTHHVEVASLDYDTQSQLLDQAEAGQWTTRELRHEVREIKQAQNRERRIEEITLESMAGKRYVVIYADPPWRYDFAETDNRAIENQYPTMEVEDICVLPVEEIANENAALFLWATAPKLVEALNVIAAWGFEYRSHCVWDKERMGMGYVFRGRHELLLYAKRGSLPAPEPADRPESVLRIERSNVHSRKPSEFYEIIDRMYPGVPKVELFSRVRRDGWDAWGLEAPDGLTA